MRQTFIPAAMTVLARVACRRRSDRGHRFRLALRQVQPACRRHDRDQAFVFAGYFAANSCAIIPPIDAPTICALLMPSASSSPPRPPPCRPADRVLRPSGREALHHDFLHVGHAQAHQMRRQSDVAIVETDDAKTLRRQPFAECLRPHRHLGGEAHDQQHGRVACRGRSSRIRCRFRWRGFAACVPPKYCYDRQLSRVAAPVDKMSARPEPVFPNGRKDHAPRTRPPCQRDFRPPDHRRRHHRRLRRARRERCAG